MLVPAVNKVTVRSLGDDPCFGAYPVWYNSKFDSYSGYKPFKSYTMNINKIINFLIAALAAILPLYFFQVHFVLGIVADFVFLLGGFIIHTENYKDKDAALVFAVVLFSVVCQTAWAIVA
mgnify:CR=1 FL=1